MYVATDLKGLRKFISGSFTALFYWPPALYFHVKKLTCIFIVCFKAKLTVPFKQAYFDSAVCQLFNIPLNKEALYLLNLLGDFSLVQIYAV